MYDDAEVTIWHPETETMRAAGRLTMRTASLSFSQDQQVAYKVGEGYSGWIAMYRQPLLISDTAARPDVMPKQYQSRYQSFVGVPLMVSDRFVGTLELSNRQRNAFTQRDVALLQTIAGQAAAAIEAARLYRDQRTRVEELNGLQQIAEAMSQLAEPAELYGQLTQRIAHLMGVDLCGVLLYDEDEGLFRSQTPFYGLPDSLMAKYRLALEPGSDLHNAWQFQAWWYTNDAASPLLPALRLEETVPAITLRQVLGQRLTIDELHDQKGDPLTVEGILGIVVDVRNSRV
jgi:GAF domain-containing protein